jgi:hypothetical protein
MQFTHQLVNVWDRVPILDGFLVQGLVINAHPHGAILLLRVSKLHGTGCIGSWTVFSILGASFRILYQLCFAGHTIQVRSPGNAKNRQLVGKLP